MSYKTKVVSFDTVVFEELSLQKLPEKSDYITVFDGKKGILTPVYKVLGTEHRVNKHDGSVTVITHVKNETDGNYEHN